jgi:alcohol dehydrogenase (NADP+)
MVSYFNEMSKPMSHVTRSYAAFDPDSPLAPMALTRRGLNPDDVLIDIRFCGVCHSDLHTAKNHWGRTQYPLVPGHEIVGVVSEVGDAVTRHAIGDWVAVGCLVDACGTCSACTDHEEQYCEVGSIGTYGGIGRDGEPTQGGYSKSIVVKDSFVLSVPQGLDPAAAAPLLCAGITSYSPLNYHNVGPDSRVGVIGLGGLGHMAVKFAAAMGATVTVFTTSESKREEAFRLGAYHVVLSTDRAEIKTAYRSLDLIVDTVPVPHELRDYLVCLKRNGHLVLTGPIGLQEPPVNNGLLMMGRKSISGSAIGGIEETQQMLNFCAETQVTCDIEMIAMVDINEAYERLERNDVHYRFVIDMSTL